MVERKSTGSPPHANRRFAASRSFTELRHVGDCFDCRGLTVAEEIALELARLERAALARVQARHAAEQRGEDYPLEDNARCNAA